VPGLDDDASLKGLLGWLRDLLQWLIDLFKRLGIEIPKFLKELIKSISPELADQLDFILGDNVLQNKKSRGERRADDAEHAVILIALFLLVIGSTIIAMEIKKK
jgi:hypothetical protein